MTRRKEKQSKRPRPSGKPAYAADYWDLYRKAQIRRRAGRLPHRVAEILHLEKLGYEVKHIDNPGAGNQEAVFHVFGNGNQGVTLMACHRSYQVHATLQSGTYNPQPPEYALRKLGIYPKGRKQNGEEKQRGVESHNAGVENRFEKDAGVEKQPQSFKPARSYWSWRKHFKAANDLSNDRGTSEQVPVYGATGRVGADLLSECGVNATQKRGRSEDARERTSTPAVGVVFVTNNA